MSLQHAELYFDANGAITCQLHAGIDQARKNIRHNLLSQKAQDRIAKISKLVVFDQAPNVCKSKRRAFRTGAEIAYAAFLGSDISGFLQKRTETSFGLKQLPIKIHSDWRIRNDRHIDVTSIHAHIRHPEMSEATGLITEYYTEATKSSTIGRLARVGVGYTMTRLEVAAARAEAACIEEFSAEIDTINWETFR